MSEEDSPKPEGQAEETAEDTTVDPAPETSLPEQDENVIINEEKKDGITEETMPESAASETEENIAAEGTSKETISERPSRVDVKQEPFASKETSEIQPTEEKTENLQEKIAEGAEGATGKPSPETGTELHQVSTKKIDEFPLEDHVSSKQDMESRVREEEIEAHPLDELTDQQVIEVVNEIEMENRHLELENILFENFLKENDPSLLEGLDEIMSYLIEKSTTFEQAKPAQERQSIMLDRQRLKLDSYTSITSIAEGKGPKINLSQKTDMVMRAMEENQASLEAFLKKTHIAKRNLKSELEEFSIREAEIKEATDIFEYSVVTQGLDKLTQRIPAEKFVRYMEEWLKSAQLQIEKLRLRIATLKVQYKKVSQQLIQRQELGENVHAVDFDQLEIENKHFIEKIEQKNIHLVELKKMNGSANLVLSMHKKFLQKQQDDCNKLKEEIEFKNVQIEQTEEECNMAEGELKEIYEKYEHCKNLKNQYTVPDVMEYVRLKGKMHELRKNMKIWVRRRKIQDIALNTCLREMKNLTGCTNIDPDWFQDDQSLNSDDNYTSDYMPM